MLTPEINYDVTLTVKNFIDATGNALQGYAYDCTMVTLSVSSSAFTEDYAKINFELNKAFSIQDASLLVTEEFHQPVQDNLNLSVSLKERFTYRDNDQVLIPANALLVQSCIIDTDLASTVQPDAQKLNPVSDITFTEDDVDLFIDATGSDTSYPLQPD